jgi:hypothetical protein
MDNINVHPVALVVYCPDTETVPALLGMRNLHIICMYRISDSEWHNVSYIVTQKEREEDEGAK